jgi:hypothetical protein
MCHRRDSVTLNSTSKSCPFKEQKTIEVGMCLQTTDNGNEGYHKIAVPVRVIIGFDLGAEL